MTLIKNRKPISITTTSVFIDEEDVLVTNVICDDGSIWKLVDSEEGWKRLPDIPGERLDTCSSTTSNTQVKPVSSKSVKSAKQKLVETCTGNCDECNEQCPFDQLTEEEIQQAEKFVNDLFNSIFKR